jgi:two-component system OmpR family sensor kinase
MIVLVALGLAVVDVITLSSLRTYLYGRVDDQLSTAAGQVERYVARSETRGFPITASGIRSRVSPDIYVELVDRDGTVVVARPSDSQGRPDPAPALPRHLTVTPLPSGGGARHGQAYRPHAGSVNVGSTVAHGPEYRMQATALPGRILVVATRLDSVTATLNSLRAIELAVSLGLLAVLLVLMTVLIRLGLRPLEDMAKEADAIAAGDLTRRVPADEGSGEIARLGRALNGMLTQIETAFSQRERSEERLRSFLADASHELRTPLTSIRGYAELLQKDALTDRESRDRALSRIEQEAARMGSLVGDLSLLAREGEGPEPARYRVDLSGAAAKVVTDASVIDHSRHIELVAPRAVPVFGDDARIEQMIHNLLGNALAHTPPGTPVRVQVRELGGQALLEVHDQGQGMTPEQAARVFDRFYRGDAVGADGGSGLGLFIVASLARTFGGQAWVDTAPGQGSTFRVVLPLYGTHPAGGASGPDGPGDGRVGRDGGEASGAGADAGAPGMMAGDGDH